MKIVTGFFVGFLFLLFAAAAGAQERNSLVPSVIKDRVQTVRETASERKEGVAAEVVTRRETTKEKLDTLREEAKSRREVAATKKEEVKQKIAEKRAETFKQLVSRLVTRLEAYTERLSALADRLEQRVERLAEKGADTASARTKLEDARGKIETVKGDITALNGSGDDLVSSENPKDFFAALKDHVANIKAQFVDIHQTLASVLREVKGLSSVQKTEGEVKNED